MNNFKTNEIQLIVYTDLDGTLLNHQDYSFAPAIPALSLLSQINAPVIPVTSKTLVEAQSLANSIGLHHPIIVENGSLLAFPEKYFKKQSDFSHAGKYWCKQVSADYKTIIETIHKLREQFNYDFQGFADMSVDEVMQHTGLNTSEAENAKQRAGTEPILWLDSPEKRLTFTKQLKEYNLTLTRGGRFWHVMGNASKGKAIEMLNALYRKNEFIVQETIGLGDSPNDISMLRVVDVPVIVQSHDGSYMNIENSNEYARTEPPGPDGWNRFITHYLEENNLIVNESKILKTRSMRNG